MFSYFEKKELRCHSYSESYLPQIHLSKRYIDQREGRGKRKSQKCKKLFWSG